MDDSSNTPAPVNEALALLETDPKYRHAEDLFMSHATLADISRATGISTKVLKRWKKDGEWDIRREDEDRGILETNFGARKVSIAQLVRYTSDELLRGVKKLMERQEAPNLDEMTKLSMILGNLDKISRLDNDKATENIKVAVANVNLSAQQLREAFMSDPFFEMPTQPPSLPLVETKDAEFTEVKNES